jgi:dienelactone hydrolase
MLGRRVRQAAEWLATQPEGKLPIGCFGSSTGAAAALIAAADRPDLVRAVVSRGGRPDLAGEALPRVEAPTLLPVGDLAIQPARAEAQRAQDAEHRGAGQIADDPFHSNLPTDRS